MVAIDRLLDLCQAGINLITKFDQNIYFPLLSGEKEVLTRKQFVDTCSNEAFGLITKIVEEPLLNMMLANTLQSYHFPFEMDKHHLPDRIENPKIINAMAIHKTKEWFSTVGQLVLSSKHYMLNGKQKIDTILEKEYFIESNS